MLELNLGADEEVKHHYEIHERPQDYRELKPGDVAYYDMMIRIDLLHRSR